MSLEEELVLQEMNEGKDRQHVLDTVDGLRKLGVTVNSARIETALKRYELIKEYNSKENQKKDVKTVVREKIAKLTAERIEELKNNPNILSAKPEGGFAIGWCPDCEEVYRDASVKVTYIKKAAERLVKNSKYVLLYSYCEYCGKIKEGKDLQKLLGRVL